MTTTNEVPLKPNPFTTYRDPQTGKWVVVLPSTQPQKPRMA
jgi:hypothetical protein